MSHTKLNYEQTAALFRGIATQHKQINAFVEVDLQEIKEVVKSTADLPALLYSSFREGLADKSADNVQSRKRIFFAVIDRSSTKLKNARTPHQMIDDCRDLALDVISYLRKEKRENRLTGFLLDSVSDGDVVFMRDDDFFGWEFSLEISTPMDISFKPEKWEIE
jgi:hypothetical protein